MRRMGKLPVRPAPWRDANEPPLRRPTMPGQSSIVRPQRCAPMPKTHKAITFAHVATEPGTRVLPRDLRDAQPGACRGDARHQPAGADPQPAATRGATRSTAVRSRAARRRADADRGRAARARRTSPASRCTMQSAKSRQLAAGKVGKVRVGAGHVVARLVSQSLLPRFIVERPTAQIHLHVGFNAELFGLLEAGNLDFAVCGLRSTAPAALSGTPPSELRRDRAYRSPLTKLGILDSDLAGFRSAAPSAGVPARQLVERVLTKFGLGTGPTPSKPIRGGDPRGGQHDRRRSAWRRATKPCAMAGRRASWQSASRSSNSSEDRHPHARRSLSSPLAARAIELIEGFAEHASSKAPRPARVRLTSVR